MYSAFIQVRPTLLDYIRVFVNWEDFEAGSLFFDRINREDGRFFPCYLTFKQRFAKRFGTSWTLRYCADRLFMDFAVFCALCVSVCIKV